MKEIVYQYSNKGYFLGETIAYNGNMPIGTTTIAPSFESGCIPYWNGKSWEQVENHVGEKGYVNNEFFEITEYGKYPTGWTSEYVKSFEEIQSEKLNQAEQITKIFKARTLEINGLNFPKDYSHIYEWLTFAKYKSLGVVSNNAIMVDSLGYNMNEYSVEAIEGYMFQIMREITTLNSEHKALIDRIMACKSISELKAIELVIPES